MQYTFSNKDKVHSKSLGWVSRINTSSAPNQGIHTKNRGNNSILPSVGSMPMKSGSADNDASFAMGRRDFVKALSSSPMTMNNTDQSSYLARRKALATGKIIQSAPISFSSKERNTVNSSLRKSRNKGYVVPKNVTFSRTIKDLEIGLVDQIYNPPKSCTGITRITIPSGVTTIGQGALQNCTSLTSVTIPSSVTTLGQWIFYQCTSLTTVTFEPECQITTISASVFEDCSSLSNIDIPSSVTSIGLSAFSGSGLTSITIPANLTSIGENAFYKNTSLKTVTFGAVSSLSSIGSEAFLECDDLTSITIPASVTSIDDYAFSSCTSLTTVTFEAGSLINSIGLGAFSGSGLTSITIPAKLTTVGDGAFSSCTSLTTVTFEAGSLINSIGSGAFASCTDLKEITFTSSTIPSTISSSTFPPNGSGSIKAYYTQNLSQTDIDTLNNAFGEENVFKADPFQLPSALEATYNVGETITFNTSGSNFDTELGIFDENGNLVASNDETKTEHIFNSKGKYYVVVGGDDIRFAPQFFGINIGHTTIHGEGEGQLEFGKNGEPASYVFFTIDSANKYKVYTFDIV